MTKTWGPWARSVPYPGSVPEQYLDAPGAASRGIRATWPWGLTWQRWDLGALATIAVSVALKAYLLSQSWFWQDDFLHASRALESSLSADWLLQDYNGHLKPAFFLQTWLVTQVIGMSWLVSAALVLAWTIAFGVAFWFLVTGIVAKGPAALLALAVACITPLWSVTSSWFASAMESLPTLTLGVLAAGCAVRLVQSGRAMWGAGTVVSYVAGLLWFEKGLLALMLIVFAVVATVMTGRAVSLRSRAVWVTAVALGVVAMGYTAAFLLLIGAPESVGMDPESTARLAYEMALSVVPTGLVGGPWMQNSDGSTLQVLVTQPWLTWIWAACAGVAVVGWRRHRASAMVAVGAVIVALIPLVWLVARARLDFLGPAIGRDTRYSVEIIPIAALALAVLIAGGRPRGYPRWGEGPRRALIWAAPVMVVVYALVSWPSVYAVAQSRASLDVEAWVTGALASLEEHPDRILVNTPVPSRVLTPEVGDEARVAQVLAPFGVPATRFDAPALEWWRLAADASLEPAAFFPLQQLLGGDNSGCALPVRGEPVVVSAVTPMKAQGSGVPVVRITWFSAKDVVTVIQSGDQRWEVPLVDGLGFVVLPAEALSEEIIIGGLGAGEQFCVSRVEFGVMG